MSFVAKSLGKFPAIDVTVTELLGSLVRPSVWFSVTAAPLNATFQILIPDDSIDVTTTITATEADDLHLAAELIVSDLNADGTFNAIYKAVKPAGCPRVFIETILAGDCNERPGSGDFDVVVGSGGTVTEPFDNITQRSVETALFPHPKDPTKGTMSIFGEVVATPGVVGDLFVEHAENVTYGDEMNKDGSDTPIIYTVDAVADMDIHVESMRFYGNDNGIKFGKFLGMNIELINGIKVKIKSDDTIKTLDLINSTDNLKHHFSFPVSSWSLDVQAGRDDVVAEFVFAIPFPLRRTGTFSVDDYIEITIQDNLTSVIKLEFLAKGFKKEPS